MINETIAISPRTAAGLAKQTGKPAQFWLSGARTNKPATSRNNLAQ